MDKKLKIAVAQLNYHTGNFEKNADKIIAQIKEAKTKGADLVVFSELSVCGYPPRDFLEFDDFINRAEQSINIIANECLGIAAIVGAPTRNPMKEGKNLFNSALLLSEGKVLEVRNKSLLPNYDIFDEYRYFEPNRHFNIVEFKGVKIALTICEDIWNSNEDPMYVVNPMDQLIKQHPDVMINIAASPYSIDQIRTRKNVMEENVSKYKLPLLYSNLTGAQTQLIFDGGSMAYDANGNLIQELNHFEEGSFLCELNIGESGSSLNIVDSTSSQSETSDIRMIRKALVMGIREYFKKQNFSKAILGLSGGIDSAVVLALAVEALGKDNVRAVLMPSRFSSNHSVSDSLEMAQILGVPHEIISIENVFKTFEETLNPFFENKAFDLTEENLQSRCRGVMLMALSNKFGYILLNTSNKSELAVGYGTLYGDMCGGLSVIGDLYKTRVYELAKHLNEEKIVIPESIINKAPSAELRPDQKDSDSLPDYELLDKILYLYIEERKGPGEIAKLTGDEKEVNRVLSMVNRNEWKRLQAPPVLRISSKAFGPGRRVPIVAKYLN